jgi:diacylglycerol kinase family enzyme
VLFKTRTLSIRGNSAAVQIDGDAHGQLPMNFQALPGELVMVLPAT